MSKRQTTKRRRTANQNYLASSNLVKNQGTFEVAPAELKTLVAGTQIQFVETSDSITVNNDFSVTFPLPFYGVSASPDAAFSTVAQQSANILIFSTPLSFTTHQYVDATLNGQLYPTLNAVHVTADVYTKTEVDALLANAGGNVDVNAIKQAALDCIQVGSGLTIDRSIVGQITINLDSGSGGSGGGYSGTKIYEFNDATYIFDGSTNHKCVRWISSGTSPNINYFSFVFFKYRPTPRSTPLYWSASSFVYY